MDAFMVRNIVWLKQLGVHVSLFRSGRYWPHGNVVKQETSPLLAVANFHLVLSPFFNETFWPSYWSVP